MKSALAAALVLMGLSGAAAAEDLMRVYRDALENDPQIREADANRRATREARPQAWSALLPQFNGTLEANRTESESREPQLVSGSTPNSFDLISVTRNNDVDSDGYVLELRQNIFSWANWMTLRRASREVAQAEADFLAAQQDLVLRVAQRYFDVLTAQNLVEAQQAALESIGRQFEQANKRFEVGLIAITDVQEAQAARDSAAAALIDAKRQLSTAHQALREVTNQQYSALARPSETMPLATPDPADAEKWVELSMNQNAALISSRLAADIARADVNIARGGHLPTIDAVGRRSDFNSDGDTTVLGTTRTFTTDDRSDVVGLQVNIPIFSGGFTQSRVRESQFRWIAARERLTRTTRETERLARDAYLGVISEMARVKALQQALQSSQTALKATEAGYEVGTRTAVDVLGSRQTLVQAQTDYARSRYDYILNVIQLRLAAGNLDDKTVAEINQWLSATAPATPPAPNSVPAPNQAPAAPGSATPESPPASESAPGTQPAPAQNPAS